jgi:hypothetical protein
MLARGQGTTTRGGAGTGACRIGNAVFGALFSTRDKGTGFGLLRSSRPSPASLSGIL